MYKKRKRKEEKQHRYRPDPVTEIVNSFIMCFLSAESQSEILERSCLSQRLVIVGVFLYNSLLSKSQHTFV